MLKEKRFKCGEADYVIVSNMTEIYPDNFNFSFSTINSLTNPVDIINNNGISSRPIRSNQLHPVNDQYLRLRRSPPHRQLGIYRCALR